MNPVPQTTILTLFDPSLRGQCGKWNLSGTRQQLSPDALPGVWLGSVVLTALDLHTSFIVYGSYRLDKNNESHTHTYTSTQAMCHLLLYA